VTFLYSRKETYQKNNKGARMPALRVPCDAQSSRRDIKLAALRQHIPKSPAQSPLLGKPERDSKVNIKTRNYLMAYCRSAVSARFY